MALKICLFIFTTDFFGVHWAVEFIFLRLRFTFQICKRGSGENHCQILFTQNDATVINSTFRYRIFYLDESQTRIAIRIINDGQQLNK